MQPVYNFEGRVCIVTGGGSGMGAAASRMLAASGARVVIVDINGDAALALAEEIGSDRAIGVAADITKQDGVDAFISAARERFGQIDLFFNNAGILGRPGKLIDADEQAYDQIFNVNVRGSFLGLSAVLKVMRDQGKGGAIVNTASIAGLRGVAGVGLYSASKFAVIGMTRSAAKEYGAIGIRVNAICPAATITGFSAMSEDSLRNNAMSIPLGRVAEADDMARAAVWLLSDGAGFINGAIVPVDGGQTA